MRYFTGLVRFLIRHGKLTNDNPEIMAVQLCLLISAWISLFLFGSTAVTGSRPEREGEIMKLIERHIRQFFEIYQVK